jgi:Ca2+-binding EF-hand superfamily protein
MSVNATSSLKGYRSDDRTSDEKEVDAYYKLVDEIESLEEKLRALMRTDHKISLKDIDAIMQALGIVPQKRALEHMIYEVDEMVDDVICWDEFQLNYYRNINDVTGSEPSSFFRLIEFIVFDHNHKGHIMEDDVMEILFARIGANKLEKELKTIFGNNLRAAGGDGTLSLEHYLSACLLKSGRRALVC